MTDLAIVPVAGQLGDYADPTMFVELALTRAKEWLVEAVEHGQIEQIVELKSQAEAIRTYTAQKQLGKDAELNAQEIVRRAERGLGLAIRKGQAEGTVRKYGQHRGNQHANGRVRETDSSNLPPSPYSFVSDKNEMIDAYAVTDNVTDDQFDNAIAEARDEKNLSRANVVRKVRGEAKPRPTDRSEWHYRQRHIDTDRVVSEAIGLLEGVASAFFLIRDQLPAIEKDKRLAWSEALSEPLAVINRFKKELKS